MFRINSKHLVYGLVILIIFLSCDKRNYSYSKNISLANSQKSSSIELAEQEKIKSVEGLVVGIADGDTFTLLMSNDFSIKIRLNGIDCPERKQAYSQKAKKALSDLIFDKQVQVKYEKKDRYGRVLGDVYIDNKNVNQEMVKLGLAWHYKKYSKDSTLAKLENEARANKVGLWSDSSSIPPWDFRKQN